MTDQQQDSNADLTIQDNLIECLKKQISLLEEKIEAIKEEKYRISNERFVMNKQVELLEFQVDELNKKYKACCEDLLCTEDEHTKLQEDLKSVREKVHRSSIVQGSEETTLIERSMLFAIHAHRGQKRKGSGLPYILHPLSVANYVRSYITVAPGKLTIDELLACAYLHDCIEDCNITVDEIKEKFGENIASVVKELTNNDAQIKRIGKEKYIATKLLTMGIDALAVKLCDRLDNIRDSSGVYFDANKKLEIKRTNEAIFTSFLRRDKLPLELVRIRDDIMKSIRELDSQ